MIDFSNDIPNRKSYLGIMHGKTKKKMLTDALVAVIDNLENAPWLEKTLTELGRKHQEYEVTPEMFNWVGECLLDTIIDVAGDDWRAEHQQAWSEAYAAISSLMLSGYDPAISQ